MSAPGLASAIALLVTVAVASSSAPTPAAASRSPSMVERSLPSGSSAWYVAAAPDGALFAGGSTGSVHQLSAEGAPKLVVLSAANGGLLRSASRLAADGESLVIYDVVQRRLVKYRRRDWSVAVDVPSPTYAPSVGLALANGDALFAGPPPFGEVVPKGLECGEVGRVSFSGRVSACGFSLTPEQRSLTMLSFSGRLTSTSSLGRYAAVFWGIDTLFLVDAQAKGVGTFPLGTPAEQRISPDSIVRCGPPNDLEARFCCESGKRSPVSVEWVGERLAAFFVRRGPATAVFEVQTMSSRTGETLATYTLPLPITSAYDTIGTASDGKGALFVVVNNFIGNPAGKPRIVPGTDMRQRLFEVHLPVAR